MTAKSNKERAVPKDQDFKETERCQMTFYIGQRRKVVVLPGQVTALFLPGVKRLSGNRQKSLLVPVVFLNN